MRKHIITTAVLLFFISNFVHAQFNKDDLLGRWKVYKRYYTSDTASHGEGAPLKMDLAWYFEKDSLSWEFPGLARKQMVEYEFKDSTISMGAMKYVVERLSNDTLVVQKISTPKNQAPKVVYKDYFWRSDKPKKKK